MFPQGSGMHGGGDHNRNLRLNSLGGMYPRPNYPAVDMLQTDQFGVSSALHKSSAEFQRMMNAQKLDLELSFRMKLEKQQEAFSRSVNDLRLNEAPRFMPPQLDTSKLPSYLPPFPMPSMPWNPLDKNPSLMPRDSFNNFWKNPMMMPDMSGMGGSSFLKRSRGEGVAEKPEKRIKRSAADQSTKKKKSKYRGVFWHSRGRAWVSSIMVNGKTTHLGYYDCEEEAARVYDKEAIRLKGVTCAVNFPDSIERFAKNKEAATASSAESSTRHERKRAERISQYRGVCWNKCNSSWKACIKIEGKNKHIGYFSDEKAAAEAYDAKALEVRGANAKLNFPITTSSK